MLLHAINLGGIMVSGIQSIIAEILIEHKVLRYSNDLHDDSSIASCSCGHLLADESIEEHQAEIIAIKINML